MNEEKNEKNKSNNNYGTVSLVLGIITVLMIFVANGFTAMLGLTTGIVGIILRYSCNQEIKI